MKADNINSIFLNEIYNFISNYYANSALADYVMDIFSINRIDVMKSDVSYAKFFRILQYLQKMSDDHLICYNAGIYFARNKLFKIFTTPRIRFSLRKTFKNIDKVLNEIFPALSIIIDSTELSSLKLSINSDDPLIKPDYFFSEYIKGMISSIPGYWDLPSASVSVLSYPGRIEEILEYIDIPYHKTDTKYYIAGDEIAEDKQPESDSGKANSKKNIQVVKHDLFIKNIFIKKNTIMNSGTLVLSIKWENINHLSVTVFSILLILGLPFIIISYMKELFTTQNLISLFLLYEVFILFIYSLYKKRLLKKLYKKIEAGLLNELSQQRVITGEAINSTFNRLESIENLIDITKHIISEKDILTLFGNIRKLSARALNADRATVFIHDKENKELRTGPELSEEKYEYKFPEDKGIAGQILKLRNIVNVKDAYNNPNFYKAIDRSTGFETKTMLGAPLIDLEDNIFGVIQILNKKGGTFQKIDEQIIEMLSTYIAIALKDTQTIHNLQQRGIDPNIINGFSEITKYIFNEHLTIQNAVLQIEDQAIDSIYPTVINMSLFLEKLMFLFDERYIHNEESIPIMEFLESLRMQFERIKGNKLIKYEGLTSIPEESKLVADIELLERAFLELLVNSIEAIDNTGEISLRIYYSVDIPNYIMHELSIIDIFTEFNNYNEGNSSGFINFLTEKKPLLENDLKKIKDTIKEFVTFELFDTGAEIPDEIKDKIFYPFFSTKNRFGLGLAIAKTAVTRMGGTIESPVRSEKGKSIRINIPLYKNNGG